MTFFDEVATYLAIQNLQNESQIKRLHELEDFLNSLRRIRADCEAINECNDILFNKKKNKICELISCILRNYYACLEGHIPLETLEKTIISYNLYLEGI
jgi:hypothetical protein